MGLYINIELKKTVKLIKNKVKFAYRNIGKKKFSFYILIFNRFNGDK